MPIRGCSSSIRSPFVGNEGLTSRSWACTHERTSTPGSTCGAHAGTEHEEAQSTPAYALATRALARLGGATVQSSALRSCDTSRLMLPRIAAIVRATSAESPKTPAAPIVTQTQAVILPTLSA